MIRLGKHWRKVVIAGLVPTNLHTHDTVPKDGKIAETFERRKEISESGFDRLKLMFKIDEFGRISSELNSIYQAGFLGFLIGAVYGGVIQSRSAYVNFMDNNEATAFKSHLDAKRKLQDQVTVNFARGAFRWGWRVALFTTSYVGITTCISVYREKSSLYEYLAAGSITGAVYKANMGLRAMAAGGILGLFLGSIAGGASLLLLKASGTTMEEVRYWQYKWKKEREQTIQEAVNKQTTDEPSLNVAHDEKVGAGNINLDNVQ